MKFQVYKGYMKALSDQLDHFTAQGTINADQADTMKASYEVKESVGFIQAVTGVGGFMIGLGVLSYIAGNWDHIPNWGRLSLIIVAMVGFFLSGVRLEETYPKTGQAVRNISVLVYGSGLFLIDQMFHLDKPIAQHFLLWAFGAALISRVMKDKWMYFGTQILLGIAWLTSLDLVSDSPGVFYPMFGLLSLATVYLILVQEKERDLLVACLNHLMVMGGIGILFMHLEVDALFGMLVIFAYGLVWLYRPLFARHAGKVNVVLASVVASLFGFILTFQGLWETWAVIEDGAIIALAFTLAYVVWQFVRIRQGSRVALFAVCAVMARYYFDTLYDFMPKSLFFVLGGVLLTGFGLYLENLRRKEAVSNDEPS